MANPLKTWRRLKPVIPVWIAFVYLVERPATKLRWARSLWRNRGLLLTLAATADRLRG